MTGSLVGPSMSCFLVIPQCQVLRSSLNVRFSGGPSMSGSPEFPQCQVLRRSLNVGFSRDPSMSGSLVDPQYQVHWWFLNVRFTGGPLEVSSDAVMTWYNQWSRCNFSVNEYLIKQADKQHKTFLFSLTSLAGSGIFAVRFISALGFGQI
ncbi:hypothetical protein XELAEV_18021841mg [Xenopus laevis]|uniref:Uncharacterized protein n=1 Tax=Xenopus laevis TaxID=8355 RepID=A0A974D1B0_XENLA|nr:hypothetical protein XELAEV_18021841mg [Xenopus laevis]